MSAKATVVIILQYINVCNQHIVQWEGKGREEERNLCPRGCIHQEFSLFHLGARRNETLSLPGRFCILIWELREPCLSGHTCLEWNLHQVEIPASQALKVPNLSRFFWKKCFPTRCMLWEQFPQTLYGCLLLLLLCIPGMKLLPSLLFAWFQWEFLCLYNLTPESNALGWAPHLKQSSSPRSWSWD